VSNSSQYAYVLHQRPYTDSRLLIDLFTEKSGLVRVVGRIPAKRQTGAIQSFQRMHVEYWGNSSLKTLRTCESAAVTLTPLLGDSLYCGMYINELLERLLPSEEPCLELFHFYETVVVQLAQSRTRLEQESVLRYFEFFLLEYLGYAVVVDVCAETEAQVCVGQFYFFEAGSGVRECTSEFRPSNNGNIIAGEQLLAMSRHEFHEPAVLRSAKVITRQALRHLLGPKPLKSKELFR
jgi:DNA repair protein RecO (recombination protein O)